MPVWVWPLGPGAATAERGWRLPGSCSQPCATPRVPRSSAAVRGLFGLAEWAVTSSFSVLGASRFQLHKIIFQLRGADLSGRALAVRPPRLHCWYCLSLKLILFFSAAHRACPFCRICCLGKVCWVLRGSGSFWLDLGESSCPAEGGGC